MSKMMVKRDGLWAPMANLKGDTGPLPADNSVMNDALATDGAKTNTAYLIGNRLTKDAEGEFISVDDSYPSAALSLTVDGKSTQLTTTGKNLLSDVRSEWMIVSGFSGIPNTRFIYAFPMETGASLHYHRNNLRTLPFLAGWMEDPTDPSTYTSIVTLTNRADYTFTNTAGHAYLAFTISTMFDVSSLVMSEAQVEVGTTTTAYEQYSGGAASPRPDWPQEIVSVDGILLTTCGKNFVPNDDPEKPTANYTFNSSKRVVWDSEMEGFRLTDSGSGVAYAAHISRNPRAAFIAPRDGVYTFGADTKYYTSGTDFGFRAELNDAVINGYGWGSPKQSSDTDWTRHSITRTLSKGDRFGATIYQTALWRNISVVAGSEDIYEPYSGATASLLPEGTYIRSLPDGTKDELNLTYLRPSTRKGWAWYSRELVQRVRLMTLNGSEIWGKDRFGFYHRMDNLATAAGDYSKSLLCDCLAAYRQYPELAGKAGMSGYRLSATGANWLYINVEGIDTIADFRAWLAERVPTILHETTDQPITTQLGPIELPIMQAGTTNIWTDPSTSLSVTYERDRNIVISKLEAAAADLATS